MYYAKDCKNCTKKFQSKRSDSEYCSSSCRSLHRRRSIGNNEGSVADFKAQLLGIQKTLDFIVEKLNGIKMEEKAIKPLRQITQQVSSPEPEVKKKSVMDYAMQIDKLQFDEEYRAMAKEIRADANLNEKQKTALIASMNCPNI